MRYRLYVLIISLLYVVQAPTTTWSQEAVDKEDLALWLVFSLKAKPFNKNWSSSFDFEYRRRNNIRETDLYNGIVIVDYQINKYLSIGFGYEIFLNNNSSGYEIEHRYYPELIYTFAVQRFSVAFRSRVMNTFTEWEDPNWEHRNRLKIKYSIKNCPFAPFIAIEPYNQLGSQLYRLNKIRYAGGITFLSGNHQTDLYYMLENYYTRTFARHIININYAFSFR